MIIKVTYPNASNDIKDYFNVNENEFKLGDIVVVENEVESKRYGVVIEIDVKTRKKVNGKRIKIASMLDRILFWLDFESEILHNGIKMNNKSLEAYRAVGKNANLSDEQLTAKMTRNMLLIHHPYRITISKYGGLVFYYGALRITYGNGNIYNIINKCEYPKGWRKDWHKHWYYSKILGVELN